MNSTSPEKQDRPPLTKAFLERVRHELGVTLNLIRHINAGDPHVGHLRAVMWGLAAPDTIPDDILDKPHKSTSEF